MRSSSAKSRYEHLIVSAEDGFVSTAPAETTASQRWIDTHPFVQREGDRLVVGEGTSQRVYAIESEVIGGYNLRRLDRVPV